MLSDLFDINSANPSASDWLDDAWSSLEPRSREILERRAAGETLDSIGRTLHLTRERVRQLEGKAVGQLIEAQRIGAPTLADLLDSALNRRSAVDEAEVAVLIPSRSRAARSLVLASRGVKRPTLPSGPLYTHWTLEPKALDRQFRELVGLMPLGCDEVQEAVGHVGIPDTVRHEELLRTDYRLLQTELGWVRIGRLTRDRAYLWLKQQGAPRPAREIADAAGASEHATRENMRRSSAFAQVRPEGTWALSDWRIDGANSLYASAEEVVIEVLKELGPLNSDQLRVECMRRYPVSAWRISQCLSSSAIGRNTMGLYDLVERGALPFEDAEPRQPRHIQARGEVVGVEVPVTRDVLRGSGIAVNRWLTWYLGLRTAPSTRYFKIDDGSGELSVKRGTSNAQLSSLRSAAISLNVAEGCKLVLLLRRDSNTATIRHTCMVDVCPAFAAGEE